MKAQFKFNPGQNVIGPSGYPGQIILCCVGEDGNQYVVRTQFGDFVEKESNLKSATE